MLRRTFITLTAITTLGLPATAGEGADRAAGVVQVSAAQIMELLNGNTIVGTWSGSNYRQYYDASGFTVYVAEGAPPSRGKWRVKEETDEYDSWWEQTGWTPYTVMLTDKGFAWVNGETLEYFTVEKGKQISW